MLICHCEQEMEKKNFTRLSAMEKNQMETNMRLDNMQSMLQTVLSSLSAIPVPTGKDMSPIVTPTPGETSGSLEDSKGINVVDSGEKGSSEEWWDRLCMSSEDNKSEDNVNLHKSNSGGQSTHTVSFHNFDT